MVVGRAGQPGGRARACATATSSSASTASRRGHRRPAPPADRGAGRRGADSTIIRDLKKQVVRVSPSCDDSRGAGRAACKLRYHSNRHVVDVASVRSDHHHGPRLASQGRGAGLRPRVHRPHVPARLRGGGGLERTRASSPTARSASARRPPACTTARPCSTGLKALPRRRRQGAHLPPRSPLRSRMAEGRRRLCMPAIDPRADARGGDGVRPRWSEDWVPSVAGHLAVPPPHPGRHRALPGRAPGHRIPLLHHCAHRWAPTTPRASAR